MPTFYTVAPERQQGVYGDLQTIAKNFDDTPDAKALEELSQQDLFVFARDNQDKPFIELEIEGKQTPIFDSNLIPRLWQELRARDKNNDGTIDKPFTSTAIVLSDQIDASGIQPEKIPELYQQFKDSIFKTTVTRGDNSTITGYGCVIDKTDNGNGTFTYLVASSTSIVDQYRHDEKSYQLTSLSGDILISDAKLKASSSPSSVAFLSFVSPMTLTVCNPGTAAEGNALYLIGDDLQTATTLDMNSDAVGYFHTTKIQVTRPINNDNNFGTPAFTSSGLFVGFIALKDEEPYNFWHLVSSDTIGDTYKRIDQEDSVTYSNWGLYTQSYAPNDTRRLTLPTPELQKSTTGIWVVQLDENSAATKAGIKVGDIILSVDGKNTDTVFDGTLNTDWFKAFTLKSDPKKKYRITIYRPELKQAITVTLTPQTRDYQQIAVYETANGFSVIDEVEYSLEYREIAPIAKGVWVSTQTLNENGDPSTSKEILPGLSHNDIITAVNGTPTPDVATFKKTFEEAKSNNQQINLTVVKTHYSGIYNRAGDKTTCVIPSSN